MTGYGFYPNYLSENDNRCQIISISVTITLKKKICHNIYIKDFIVIFFENINQLA